MVEIYLMSEAALHEAEEMLFTYRIYKNGEFVEEKEMGHDYRKPALTGLYGIMALLKEIKVYRPEEVKVYVNDGALRDQLNGTTNTKNKDVLKVAALARKHLAKFSDTITVTDYSTDKVKRKMWYEEFGLKTN